jgi:hypothetical protein
MNIANIRTRAFFLFGSLNMASQMVVPPISAWLMTFWGPYKTAFISLVLFCCSLPLLFVLVQGQKIQVTESASTGAIQQLRDIRDHARNNILPLLKNTSIASGILLNFLVLFASAIGGEYMQYMHVRYHWSFEKTTSLMSYQATIHLIFYAAVIPVAQAILSKRLGNNDKANIVLIKASMVFAAIGSLVMGTSHSPPGVFVGVTIALLGSGFGPFMLSLLTTMVQKNETAFLYMCLTVSGTTGALAGTPLLQVALAKGIKLGGEWIGLPFYLAVVLYVLGITASWGIKPEKRVHEVEDLISDTVQ